MQRSLQVEQTILVKGLYKENKSSSTHNNTDEDFAEDRVDKLPGLKQSQERKRFIIAKLMLNGLNTFLELPIEIPDSSKRLSVSV